MMRPLFCAALAAVLAGAAPSSAAIPVSASPVVRVQMRTGDLTIRTWDRDEIEISSAQPVQAAHYGPPQVAFALHGGEIPVFAARVRTPAGELLLPPEEFAVPRVAGEPHDGVGIYGSDGASLTITVPKSTALIWAAVGRGTVRVEGYRGGAFVVRVHNGRISLADTGGDAYVEAARGRIDARDSAFNRIRSRTAIGNTVFENCNARQIEASSIAGAIAYDNGTFVPGLARFESVYGDVAIGIAGGGASIAAHSSEGRVYNGLPHTARVSGNADDLRATLGGGGPVVTAASQNGSIFLYDGALAARSRLQPEWRALQRIVKSAGALKAKTSAGRPYRA